MSYVLRVFCQSPQPISSSEITDFIRDGYFFEQPPHFQVQPNPEAVNENHWKSISIQYQTDKRFILLELNLNDPVLQAEIKETINIINQSEPFNQPQDLVQRLTTTQQVIAIDIDSQGLTDAGWEMLDCLEAYLAKRLSGIIYAPEDGFYNDQLQPIYHLETPVSIGSR